MVTEKFVNIRNFNRKTSFSICVDSVIISQVDIGDDWKSDQVTISLDSETSLDLAMAIMEAHGL